MRLKIGHTAPSFSVTDISGNSHTLDDYKGKKLMLAFHRYAT